MKFHYYVAESDRSVLNFMEERVRALRLLANYAPKAQLKQLAFGLVLSKLFYCLPVWADIPAYLCDRINVVINKAARAVTGAGRLDSMTKVLLDLKWHKFQQYVQYFDIIQLRAIIRTRVPDSLHNGLNVEYHHQHNTRARARQDIPVNADNQPVHNARHKSFIPRAIRLYNSIPQDLRSMQKEYEFKPAFRQYLFRTYHSK